MASLGDVYLAGSRTVARTWKPEGVVSDFFNRKITYIFQGRFGRSHGIVRTLFCKLERKIVTDATGRATVISQPGLRSAALRDAPGDKGIALVLLCHICFLSRVCLCRRCERCCLLSFVY